jgi:hypothetical protein
MTSWLWGDELRVMDICIGTFPSGPQPLFMLKALHIIHHRLPASLPSPHLTSPLLSAPDNIWRHFLLLHLYHLTAS